jgi:hypothetical protein
VTGDTLMEAAVGSTVTYRLSYGVPVNSSVTFSDALPNGVAMNRLFTFVYRPECPTPGQPGTGACALPCTAPPAGQRGTVQCSYTNTAPGMSSVGVAIEVTVTDTAQGIVTNTASNGATTSSASFKAVRSSVPSFAASPVTIRAGASSTLFFSAPGAASVRIDHGVVVSGTSGSVTVSPEQTTTYTLTATAADGSISTAQVTVVVITTPAILVTGLPRGLLQNPEIGGATDRISLTNTGGAATTLTLTKSGDFFTIPSTITIDRGATAVITIRGTPQGPGTYAGTITASGPGLPGPIPFLVRMLVAPPPPGTVDPSPRRNRIDIVDGLGDGAVQFTNSGTATLQGIAVADVPWLIPQNGTITIAPGQTTTVSFAIDRTKRDDAQSLSGAVTGGLALRYFDGTIAANVRRAFDAATSAIGTSRVQVVDLASPATSFAAPPPLLPGEVALFLPGVLRTNTAVTDVALNSASASLPIGDLRMFFASQLATLGALAPSSSALFSNVVDGVFKRGDIASGGLQVRSLNADRVTLGGTITNPSEAAGLYSGTIASLRSDRSAAANEQLVLAGIRVDAANRTDVYLQETAGFASSVRTDFVDELGSVRRTRTDALAPFATLELSNDAPAGAVTARVTNVATNNSRVQARALVTDRATGDVFDIVDWNVRNATSPTEPQLIVLTQGRTEIAIANGGSATASGTLNFYSAARTRQRATSRAEAGAAPRPTSTMAVSVDAGKTLLLDELPGNGYLIYTPASGRASLSVRTSGTCVPPVGVASSLKFGDSRRFATIEDAAPETIAAAEPATWRTAFGLVETSGKAVTVQVTLQHATSVQGGRVTAELSASREYTLAPRESLTVKELSRALFGADRDKLDDLHDLTLEIVVVRGQGTVVPYTLATENGSGDLVLRVE